MPITCRNSPLFFYFLPIAVLFALAMQPQYLIADDQQLADEILELANQGDHLAQFSMGLRYDTGDGVERNPKQAVIWFKKAAAAGVAGACLYLGMKYEFGAGLERDPGMAIHWYEQAANQGWPQAAFLLGTLYLKSSPPKRKKGCHWLGVAAEQGYPGATEAQQGTCPAFSSKE